MDATPRLIISVKNPELFKDIQKISKKWEKRTKNLSSPWPKDGTFDVAACESMGLRIRDHKPKDKSKKRQRKRELEFKVLSLFENEGLRYRRRRTTTSKGNWHSCSWENFKGSKR